MLAVLPKSISWIEAGQNRVAHLIKAPVFGRAFPSIVGGPGHKKSLAEETETEEEPFTFSYPEENGEISDLVNPPIEGIAGEVWHTRSKTNDGFIAGVSSDIFSYVFIDTQRGSPANMPRTELISLTRQSEITHYINLLVYSTYVSSTPFNYTSNEVYVGSDASTIPIYSGENDSLYESRVPMAMFSDKRDYQSKKTSVDYEAPKSYVYTNLALPLVEVKLDEQATPKYNESTANHTRDALTLPADVSLTNTLDMQLAKATEQDATLNWQSYEAPTLDIELTIPIVKPDTTDTTKYKADVKYEAVKTIAVLPSNLGFDDFSLRDSFIAKLEEKPIKIQDTKPRTDYKHYSSMLPKQNEPTLKDNGEARYNGMVNLKQIALPSNQPTIQSIKFEPNLDVEHNLPHLVIPARVNFKYKPQENQAYELRTASPKITLNLATFDSLPIEKGITEEPTIPQYKPRAEELMEKGEYRTVTLGYDMPSLGTTQGNSYETRRASPDPFTLFTSQISTQPTYQGNAAIREMILPQTKDRTTTRTNLASIVTANYDNGISSLPRIITRAQPYIIDWVNSSGLQQDTEAETGDAQEYETTHDEQDLEQTIERELTEEETDENIKTEAYDNAGVREEVYNDNKAETGVHEKSKDKNETETNESDDSLVTGLAVATGAVGVGVLAGAAGLVGALFKKESEEETKPDESDDAVYKSEKGASSKNCEDGSQCFADTIKWLEGKLENPSLTDKEYESVSECYAEEIKNIQRAREFIKQRESGYSCSGSLYSLFHHVNFSEEQEEKYRLSDYVRDGEAQEGFKLAATVIAGDELEDNYDVGATWVDDQKGGQSEKITLKKSSAYAQLDIGLRQQGYTPVWKIMSYIDTDTGEKRSGLYLETIAELHIEAKELLGDKDDYGMNLMGIITLINGIEPGNGTVSMEDYDIKAGDNLDVVFKNDSARYNDEIEEPKKAPEPILV